MHSRFRMWLPGYPLREWFLKRRVVFVVERETYEAVDGHPPPSALVVLNHHTIGELEKEEGDRYLEWLSNRTGVEKVASRIRNPLFNAFLALDPTGGVPIGCCWSLEAREEPLWHDKFCLLSRDALFMNAYVLPDHRRKGVYLHMLNEVFKYHLLKGACERVFIIVENGNVSSMRALERLGLPIAYRNVLIKLFGGNVFSIYRRNAEIKVHYVFRNEKSKML